MFTKVVMVLMVLNNNVCFEEEKQLIKLKYPGEEKARPVGPDNCIIVIGRSLYFQIAMHGLRACCWNAWVLKPKKSLPNLKLFLRKDVQFSVWAPRDLPGSVQNNLVTDFDGS